MGSQERGLEMFERHHLSGSHSFYSGRLPECLVPDPNQFEYLWGTHPAGYHKIKMMGRLVNTPRWQQSYGVDYHYTGRVNRALPVPELIMPLLLWARNDVDGRLNGVLVNWYDGALGHYIGRHRDSTINVIEGTPIVTISFGEERVFRLRPYLGCGGRDFLATHGGVFVTPYETNLAWTHEVPHSRTRTGRRISVTLRAFNDA